MKKWKGVLAVALAMALIPVSNFKAFAEEAEVKERSVSTQEEFKEAIEAKVPTINITEDIQLTEKLNILHDVRIIGNGKTLTGNKEGESNLYAFHFYKVNQAFVSDLNFKNMDAALLVNGSNVTLFGTIDVSNNKFVVLS